jgi:hypothetical protein
MTRAHGQWGMMLVAGMSLTLIAGCDLFHPGKRQIKRDIEQFAINLALGNWEGAHRMLHPRFVWIDVHRRSHRQDAGKRFLAGIRSVNNRRGFTIHLDDLTMIEADKMVASVKMRLQTTEGIIDVGNYIWDAQMLWVKHDKTWLIGHIRDLSERQRSVSK